VQGPDGNRVPLLRPGFRPTESYTVSFVFMHSGAPFAKKGGAELNLPKMDIPINLLNWEVFLPEQYKVKDFGGDVIAANRVPVPFREEEYARNREGSRDEEARIMAFPGQMGGYVSDPSGAMIANARVIITSSATGATRTMTTDSSGHWLAAGMPSGNFKARVETPGFNTSVFNLSYDASQPSMYSFPMSVAAASETVEVSAAAAQIQTDGTVMGGPIHGASDLPSMSRSYAQLQQMPPGVAQNAASENVINLQKRVAGVLPVAIDVPRAGTSFAFVRPLVLDEETKVTFSYKSR